MTYFINNDGMIALDWCIVAEDIHDPTLDNFDEVLDELSNMRFSTFKKRYPDVHKKYYIDKEIKSTHITIEYNYPLIAPIKKIYKSDTGFSLNDIATIIRKEYLKFYEDYEASEINGSIPKYLPKNVIGFDSLSIRFWDDESGNDIPNICIGCDT